jgi:hypothetical protein
MSKLKVEDNWGYYSWSFRGKTFDPETVKELVCGDIVLECHSKTIWVQEEDHGKTMATKTRDLFVEALVEGGIPVTLSVADHPSIRAAVTEVIF